jgi:hypothetical protein
VAAVEGAYAVLFDASGFYSEGEEAAAAAVP